MNTNITEGHKALFSDLTSGESNCFCLLSCFVNGKPAAAICTVYKTDDDDDAVEIIPYFVSITNQMVLTDHEGVPACPLADNSI